MQMVGTLPLSPPMSSAYRPPAACGPVERPERGGTGRLWWSVAQSWMTENLMKSGVSVENHIVENTTFRHEQKQKI